MLYGDIISALPDNAPSNLAHLKDATARVHDAEYALLSIDMSGTNKTRLNALRVRATELMGDLETFGKQLGQLPSSEVYGTPPVFNSIPGPIGRVKRCYP